MQKVFSEYIYLFIGETCYNEEWILCLKYKYIPIFYYRFCKCLYIFCIKENDDEIAWLSFFYVILFKLLI